MTNVSYIAKNTLALYFRQILIMLVSLYTVRVVLVTLGAVDYGIYNVASGIVTMLSFLTNSMATASQRFFSFDLGKSDFEHLKRMFSLSLIIYFIFSVFIVLVAETAGLWILKNKLVIPQERMRSAIWIYQFSIFSFVFTVMTSPFMADIIAHEKMDIYALVGIVEVLLRLFVVFILGIFKIDKLFLYGFLMFFVTVVNTTIYRTICKLKFKECHFRFYWNKNDAKKMFGFVGWNLFGSFASVVRNQGINILLNMFFTPVVNAARSIAYQVNAAVLSFSNNFSVALRPQIIKNYAQKNFLDYKRMIFYGSKLTFYLMSLLSLPLIIEAPFVLNLWLKNIPDYTVIFVRLVLIDSLVDSATLPFTSAIQATGKMALYQIMVGGILIMNLPVSYIFLKIGLTPESTMIVAIIISLFALILRVVFVERLVHLNLQEFLYKYLPVMFGLCFFSFVIVFNLNKILRFENSFAHFICTLFFSSVIQLILILFVGMDKSEREKILRKIK